MSAMKSLYKKKFDIAGAPVAVAGACFARHLGPMLKKHDLNFIDVEPPPPQLPEAMHLVYGFNQYSARFGPICTARQMLQLVQRALGDFEPQDKYWAHGEGFIDPFRPFIEPRPYISKEEALEQQEDHLERVKILLESCSTIIFVLNSSIAWEDQRDGAVYPVRPLDLNEQGSLAPYPYQRRSFTSAEQIEDLTIFFNRLLSLNKDYKLILMLAPPADAVLPRIKSYANPLPVAATQNWVHHRQNIDYFPAFELLQPMPERPCSQELNTWDEPRASSALEEMLKIFLEAHKAS